MRPNNCGQRGQSFPDGIKCYNRPLQMSEPSTPEPLDSTYSRPTGAVCAAPNVTAAGFALFVTMLVIVSSLFRRLLRP